MKQVTWLWMGLAIGLAAPAMGQPAQVPPSAAPAARSTKPKRPRRTPAKPKPPVPVAAAAVSALSGNDVEAAAKAAHTLGVSEDPVAHEALLDALALGVPPAVAVPALEALAHHPAPPDLLALLRYANHINPSVRSAALASLATYPGAEAHAAVVGALHDPAAMVRATAARAAGRGKIRTAVEPLMKLLALGEDPAARALAALADGPLARTIADQLGKVPDATLALTLGTILRRAEVPEPLRVEVVRAIAKIQDPSAVTALTDYIDATPKKPARVSRQEAELVVEARRGGGR